MLEDPLTGDFASRIELEDEEEAAIANNLPSQYTVEPTIHIASQFLSPSTLIVLIGPSASILVHAAFGSTTPAGTITVPELQKLKSPLEEEEGLAAGAAGSSSFPHRHLHSFQVLALSSNPKTLVAFSRRPLPAEQAVTWTRTVLGTLSPTTVTTVSFLLSMEYRGPGDPADEPIIFHLSSTSAGNNDVVVVDKISTLNLNLTPTTGTVPQLPPGTVLTGLPAAVLEYGELHSIPTTCIVTVESAPVPEPDLVCALGDVVAQRAACLGPLTPETKKELRDALDSMYRASASNSMFI